MTYSSSTQEHETKLRRFVGHVAVITGAAKGIGRACAVRFAQEGAHVACLDVHDTGNAEAVETCRRYGADAISVHCDVTKLEDIQRAVDEVMRRWGRIDILVAAAGIYTGGLLTEVSVEQWQRVIDINLTGVFLCNKVIAPLMAGCCGGSIINISSMSGKTSWPGTHEYSASKSGVIGLTHSVAMEMAPYGVTVNAVCPGNTRTELVMQAALKNAPREGLTPEEWLARRANDCPMKRLAEPWEIAGLCAFLASEDARYITGQAIEIDGGMVLT
ncbi:MAG: SDR family oxidoreductase [Anaerolineae bacterium]|nr:SDR family oxidoreductase [Thermoflexales bacterium]MDW8407045.1 SDR family oxidoreductase [Anaerolineae bacterium]